MNIIYKNENAVNLCINFYKHVYCKGNWLKIETAYMYIH